jgi:hypothetical protein
MTAARSGSQLRGVRRCTLLACAALSLFCGSCHRRPLTPDLDGLPSGATNLQLEQRQINQLHCIKNDCADWYRLSIPERGDLRLEVRAPELGSGGQKLSLTLAGERGQNPIANTMSVSDPDLGLAAHLQRGLYLVEVGHSVVSKRAKPLSYDILAHYERWEPPPEPTPLPEPQFETLISEVLEVVARPNQPDTVLLSKGSRDAVQEDLYGRLIKDGAEIVEIQIIEVYPDGSRAQLLDYPVEPIDHTTVAEIDIPVSGSAPAQEPNHRPARSASD